MNQVHAQNSVTPDCKRPSDYKIVSSHLIFLYCEDGIPSDLQPFKPEIFSLGSSSIDKLPYTIAVTPFSDGDSYWLRLRLIPTSNLDDGLQGGKKYRLAFQAPNAGAGSGSRSPIDIDTTGTGNVVARLGDIDFKRFIATSHLGFRTPNDKTKVMLQRFIGDQEDLPAKFETDVEYIDPTTSTDGISDPGALGRLNITLEHSLDTGEQQFAMSVSGLVDVFGEAVKFDPSARIKVPQAPGTKEAADYYFKIDYAAGVGAKPAWVFESKVAPRIGGSIFGFRPGPDLETDIGENSISGIKYNDTVDLGLSGTRGFPLKSNSLQFVLATAGVTYETDKELDKDNLLGTLDGLFNFKGLYAPRKYRTIAVYQKLLKDPKYQSAKIQLEDVKPVFWGYGLDFHLGFEGGAALVDTTATASVGKAKINVPSYDILRVKPQVHGFVEAGSVTFDVKVVGRYLAITENTVNELPNHSLLLNPINGWHGYAEGNVTWNVDPTGHIGLNLVYKNGYSPPKFVRVNTVQIGVVIKY